jgi:hypothetical protein
LEGAKEFAPADLPRASKRTQDCAWKHLLAEKSVLADLMEVSRMFADQMEVNEQCGSILILSELGLKR